MLEFLIIVFSCLLVLFLIRVLHDKFEKPVNKLISKGYTNIDNEEYEEALRSFNDAISLDSKELLAYLGKGNVFFLLGQYNEALIEFQRVINQNPNSEEGEDALMNIGTIYAELERYEDAIVQFDMVLKLNPNNYSCYYNKGCVLQELDKIDESLHCFDESIRIEPNFAMAIYKKSLIFAKRNNNSEAIKLLKKAIKKDKSIKELIKNEDEEIFNNIQLRL